ncbi:MAG: hypothetical protein D6744_00715 [Planctomycetota bacterium]|nr:MAG: hypothetical protein D6744_00715 [Planctomycetota bacterium]
MDIRPGSDITVEITATPTGAAARKTLTRVCSKDPHVAKLHRYRKTHRPSWTDKRRGGRFWHHQMKSRPAVRLESGAKYSLRATVDVIRDLQSVRRWVKVSG